MNPFEGVSKADASVNYAEYVRELFAKHGVGDSFLVKTFGRDLNLARSNIKTAMKKEHPSIKYKTRSNDKGELYAFIVEK